MKNRARQWAGTAAAVLAGALVGCGGATSIDGRWDSDAGASAGQISAPQLPAEPPQTTRDPGAECPLHPAPEQFYGYRPVGPLEFWLGSQAALPLSVAGAGYFVSRDVEEPTALRFSREVQLAVAPDGSLEDERGEQLLGYGTGVRAGGPCLAPLYAPQFGPPQATQRVSFSMNLDPRNVALTFDVLSPSASANSSVSFLVFDSLGGPRIVDVYFVHEPGSPPLAHDVSYHVLVDGSDLEGGTPGTSVEIGTGWLSFTTEGALNIATTPDVAISFSGAATPGQVITLDFGPDITTSGSTGFSQVTAFATEDAVYALSVDGNSAGTGEGVSVDAYGEVSVLFDNGTALPIGKLALARFAREAALATDENGGLRATPRSGPAAFGNPLSPGRGSVQSVFTAEPQPAQPAQPAEL